MNFTPEQRRQLSMIHEATNRTRLANRDARFRRALAHAVLVNSRTTDQTAQINERTANYEELRRGIQP